MDEQLSAVRGGMDGMTRGVIFFVFQNLFLTFGQ